MKALTGRLEKLLLLFLFLNPFLDIVGGVYTKMSETYPLPGVSPSLLVRMLVLVVMGVYLLAVRDWKAVLTVAPVGVVFLLSLLLEVRDFYAIDLSTDVQYIVRFAFNLTGLLCYRRVLLRCGRTREELLGLFDRLFRFSAALLSLAIVLPYLFGVGYYTYGDRFGFRGCRGFFYSGNDITAVLMLLLPLCFAALYQLKDLKAAGPWAALCHIMPPAFTVTAMLLIGTKTAFLSLAAVLAAALGWALWTLAKKKDRRALLRFCGVVLGVAVTLLVLKLFAPSDIGKTISESFEKPAATLDDIGITNTILSGRQVKLKNALRMWKEALPLSALVGVGRGTQATVVEMDIFEVFFYYGLLGFGAMLWIYFREGVRFLGRVFHRFDLRWLMLFVGLGLCVGYLLIAGHVLFSVTSGFWFALILVYSGLYAGEPEKTNK